MAKIGLKLRIGGITAVIANVLEAGLALWHKMIPSQLTGSDRLSDSSTNTNSAALVTGRAMSFDGVNDYITIGDVSELDFERTDTFSISFYMNTSTASDGVICKQGTSSPNTGWSLFIDGGGDLTLQLVNTVGTNWIVRELTAEVTDGNWYHIVVTYDGSSSASGVTFYVDGEESASTAAADNLSASIQTSSEARIGARDSGSFFNGDLASIKIFNVELTDAQAQELYDNPEQVLPTGASASNLIAYFPFSETAGPYAINVAGNTNGILNGSTYETTIGDPLPQFSIVPHNRYMLFDGSNDYVDISAIGDFAGEFTYFAAFIGDGTLLGSSGGADSLEMNNAERLIVRVGGTDRQTNFNTVFYQQLNRVVVKRDSSNAVQVYVNGTELALYNGSSYVTGGVVTSGTVSFDYINRDNTTYSDVVVGEVAFYNTELTDSQCEDLSDNTIKADDASISGDLVGHFQNRGTTDADWSDLSGNSNDGTVSGSPEGLPMVEGATALTDVFGLATGSRVGLKMTDGGSHALVSDDATLDLTTAITIDCWVKPFSVDTEQTIVGKDSAYALKITSGAKPAFSKYTSSTETETATTSTTLSANTWYHLAVTYDTTNVIIYIDGAEDTSTAVSGNMDTNANDVLMGALASGSENFDGIIDSVKIYSSALTAANISANYNAEKGAHSNT